MQYFNRVFQHTAVVCLNVEVGWPTQPRATLFASGQDDQAGGPGGVSFLQRLRVAKVTTDSPRYEAEAARAATWRVVILPHLMKMARPGRRRQKRRLGQIDHRKRRGRCIEVRFPADSWK